MAPFVNVEVRRDRGRPAEHPYSPQEETSPATTDAVAWGWGLRPRQSVMWGTFSPGTWSPRHVRFLCKIY